MTGFVENFIVVGIKFSVAVALAMTTMFPHKKGETEEEIALYDLKHKSANFFSFFINPVMFSFIIGYRFGLEEGVKVYAAIQLSVLFVFFFFKGDSIVDMSEATRFKIRYALLIALCGLFGYEMVKAIPALP